MARSNGDQHDPLQDHERRRARAIDTMASWAMEGLEPDEDTLGDIRAYVEGDLTLDELIEKGKSL